MNQEFEDKINNDIRMIKRELIEIKEMIKVIHTDINKLLGKNRLTRSNSFTNLESYKNEKCTDLVQESPRLTKNKSWRLSSPRGTSPETTHFRRRATEGSITYTKPSF